MDIKISTEQFNLFKSGEITSSFEMLDVNNDNTITEEDLARTTDEKIKKDIQNLLNANEEDTELKTFSLDEINSLVNTVVPVSIEINETETDIISKILGFQNIDTTDLKGKTHIELNNMLVSIDNNIKLLGVKLNELNDEKANLEAEKIPLETQKSPFETQKKEENAKLMEANLKLNTEKENLGIYQKEFEQAQEELEYANTRIMVEQKLETQRYEKKMEEISNEIIAKYDPSVDGEDFEAYFAKELSGVGYPIFNNIKRFNDLAGVLQNKTIVLLNNLTSQSKIVWAYAQIQEKIQTNIDNIDAKIAIFDKQINVIDMKINQINTNINKINNEINVQNNKKASVVAALPKIKDGGLTAAEILNLIPQAEIDLAKKHNIDLTKCIIAKGKEDGIWHIYQSSSNGRNYESLARAYGKNGGYDIISSGNGRLYNLNEVNNGIGNENYQFFTGTNVVAVYRFSELNDDWSDGVVSYTANTYTTSSPLSFDIDGDGVKTTNTTVSFDIDADGQLDTINNSDDYVLAFDKDGDGVAGKDASELFGDNTDLDGDGVKDGYANGFDALKALAEKEGLISEKDSALDEKDLNLLSEKYGLVLKKGYDGKAENLSDLGITQINLAQTNETKLVKNFDGQKNDLMTQEGATFVVNGQTRDYADLWHSKKDVSSKNEGNINKSEKINKKQNNNLVFNIKQSDIKALKGKVDYEKIKEDAIENLDIPEEVLDKLLELEEES